MKIISITGTKGKTTITRALGFIIHQSGEATLRVDTDGHYVNENQISTLQESKDLFGLVPTVCPGKFLLDMKKYFPNFTAILETAIGSSRRGGLGYKRHKIGIFSNVLEDHLGVTERLQTREDIAKAKSFIFSAIGEGGYAIFNADDKLVCSQLPCIPKQRSATLIPIGYTLEHFNTKDHLEKGGCLITVEGNNLILKTKDKIYKLLNFSDINWTFEGMFRPSIYNLMLIIGGIYAFNEGNLSKIRKHIKILTKYTPDNHGGRLTLLKNKRGVKIIIDFAHEKYSIREVASLAEKLSENKTIGVIRLAPDRTNKMILETGQFIADCFDYILIYDKIDGVTKKIYVSTGLTPTRKKGEVSQILLNGIKSKRKSGNVARIIVEERAIEKASQIAQKGDVVVIICGDSHKKTINYVKKYFKASFSS